MTQLQTLSSPAAAAPPQSVVHAVALTKIFRDFWLRAKAKAVDGISFDIHRGEVFGLLGPNGAGKSTTIKIILGLLRPTTGKVLVLDKSPEDVNAKKRIGYLPEESYLYRFLNARETLDYYGRLFKLDGEKRRNRIDKLLEMVGLEGVQRRAVGEYSKGMQRRIGLAQALINDPDLLILDEPTTGMDPIGTRQIKDIILELSRRGKTIILCSHLLADVEDVCDRVAIMYGGKIRALGTTDELLVRQDMTTLESSVLDAQTIEEIERVLERRGKHLEKVRQPRQSLEAFFLDIVNQAQAEGLQTSGARNTGAIADFLVSSPGAAGQPQGEKVLSDLLQTQTPAPAPAATPAAQPADAAGEALEAGADQMLAHLMQDKWKQAQEEGRPAASPAAPTKKPGGAAKPADPFENPPTADEQALMNQLGSHWKTAADPKPKQSSSSPEKPAKAGSGEDEKADRSFLDALSNAQPFTEGDDADDASTPPKG